MINHLWVGADPPWEYVELVLCRDVYHCRPSELDVEDWDRVQGHLRVIGAEAKIRRR